MGYILMVLQVIHQHRQKANVLQIENCVMSGMGTFYKENATSLQGTEAWYLAAERNNSVMATNDLLDGNRSIQPDRSKFPADDRISTIKRSSFYQQQADRFILYSGGLQGSFRGDRLDIRMVQF